MNRAKENLVIVCANGRRFKFRIEKKRVQGGEMEVTKVILDGYIWALTMTFTVSVVSVIADATAERSGSIMPDFVRPAPFQSCHTNASIGSICTVTIGDNWQRASETLIAMSASSGDDSNALINQLGRPLMPSHVIESSNVVTHGVENWSRIQFP